jgi:hypothetical protein
MLRKTILFLALLLVAVSSSFADDILQDTVWVRTNQGDPFHLVKFSHNDSIVVGHGDNWDMFFEVKSGIKFKMLPCGNEVFFINNDQNFIRLNKERTKFEILDMNTWQVIDTLENDGTKVNEYTPIDMSKDEKYIVAPISHGFRIWDLQTKKIYKTRVFPSEENLIYVEVTTINFTCDNAHLIGHFVKTYQDPKHPGDQSYNKTYGSFVIYDLFTLDSLDSYTNARGYRISNTCKYIAKGTGDPDYGVELYDFNTKQLLHQFPVNGPSLTGIEFSNNDKYLVTTGNDRMDVWDLESENYKNLYNYQGTGFQSIDISKDDKFIVFSVADYIFIIKTKFNPNLIDYNLIKDQIKIIPNPNTGIIKIIFNLLKEDNIKIILIDAIGNQSNSLYDGLINSGIQNLDFDLSYLTNGSYFIAVMGSGINQTFNIIINK